MFVKLHTRISKRMWLGRDTTDGNPIYVSVLNLQENYTDKIIGVYTTKLGEVWETKPDAETN
jgi:hypothetical protein